MILFSVQKQYKRRFKKREKKWPTSEEFWASTETKEFWLVTSRNAEWRKFKRWFNNQIKNNVGCRPYNDVLRERFPELEVCNNYEKQYEIDTRMVVLNYDFTYFMDEESKKKLTDAPDPIVSPWAFDLSKAERVNFSADDISAMKEEQDSL